MVSCDADKLRSPDDDDRQIDLEDYIAKVKGVKPKRPPRPKKYHVVFIGRRGLEAGELRVKSYASKKCALSYMKRRAPKPSCLMRGKILKKT